MENGLPLVVPSKVEKGKPKIKYSPKSPKTIDTSIRCRSTHTRAANVPEDLSASKKQQNDSLRSSTLSTNGFSPSARSWPLKNRPVQKNELLFCFFRIFIFIFIFIFFEEIQSSARSRFSVPSALSGADRSVFKGVKIQTTMQQ